ncbi:MAG: TPR end-of-group domain-containing protein [Bacillota bacterium]
MKVVYFILTAFLLQYSTLLYPQNSEPRDLSRKIDSLIKAHNFDEAIKLQLALLKARPGDSSLMYNIACCYSLSQKKAEALDCLRKAVEYGYNNYILIANDKDLDLIKNSPEYNALIEKAKTVIAGNSKQNEVVLNEGEWMEFNLKKDSGSEKLPEVRVALLFDRDSLKIRAIVKDRHFRDSERGWRYGDGFLINFTFPGQSGDSADTENFYGYGFSLENKKPAAVLINKDGNYLLKKTDQYAPVIKVDSSEMQAYYYISLPWQAFYPFHPVLDQSAGINIIYTSQNDDKSRIIIKYIDDPFYDTEFTPKRRYAPLKFVLSGKTGTHFYGKLETRLVLKNKAKLKFAVYSEQAVSSPAQVICILSDSSRKEISKEIFKAVITPGRNLYEKEFNLPEGSGVYNVSASLGQDLYWKDSFVKIDPGSLKSYSDQIEEVRSKSSAESTSQNIAVLEYYSNELKSRIESFNDRKDPFEVKKTADELQYLLESFRTKGSVYLKNGYMVAAFRSCTDSTLQPFSIFLPERFDPKAKYNLIAALHGSGEDERYMVNSVGKEFSSENTIVIGPRGRNLSSWYTDKTEQDIICLTEMVKKMFRIDKTVLYGFSMGGYGVWRMSFMHPEMFDGAVVISGIPFNLVNNTRENNLKEIFRDLQTEKIRKIPFLVIHGTEDHSLLINYTDDFIEELKRENCSVQYIRVPGGGHGNFKSMDKVREWFNRINFHKAG